MRFSWDKTKARTNLTKHGVSFEEAATAFADPLALVVEDLTDPERVILVGTSASERLLLTVFIEKDERNIRIISARRATSHERRRYEEEGT